MIKLLSNNWVFPLTITRVPLRLYTIKLLLNFSLKCMQMKFIEQTTEQPRPKSQQFLADRFAQGPVQNVDI